MAWHAAGDTPLSRAEIDQVVARGIEFLRARQANNGSFSRETGTGVTSLVATSLLRHGRTIEDPLVAKSIAFILTHVRDDGGIYQEESLYRNYETCLAVMCLVEANKDGRFTEVIQRAEAFLKRIQWDHDEDKDISDPAFGGAGYGSHKRPDLSNTSFLIETLRSIGNDANDEAIQKALTFVSRCQNLESEHNTTPFAAKNPDGGFYYTPAAGGTSQAGPTESGGLRSYASMTYAGLKSMIYAGVTSDDPRVRAATEWIRKNYDLKSNPGLDQAGLYYYYHTFAKALDALGQATFVDQAGMSHDWRSELATELGRRQQPNGSWVNVNERWLEGNADLVTGYALLALSYCRER
jgi:squalene-hopene/tetraprenyl-beta-curcumene cyclase